MAKRGLLIGELAEQTETNPKTIRYYEAIGVLPAPERGENRYRLYTQGAIRLLQFIKKAQGLGFTLSEIKAVVDVRREGRAPCIHVRALLERRIADLDRQLTDMLGLRRKLKRLLTGLKRRGVRGTAEAVVCPHIEGIPLESNPPK